MHPTTKDWDEFDSTTEVIYIKRSRDPSVFEILRSPAFVIVVVVTILVIGGVCLTIYLICCRGRPGDGAGPVQIDYVDASIARRQVCFF